jgi:hypothetical protein
VSTKRSGGDKERYIHNQQLKDSGKSLNKNTMSPPPPYTNFQTSTTPTSSATSSTHGNMTYYGSQPMYPQMYPHHMDHQLNHNSSQQLRGSGIGRRGRARGGNSGNRREYHNTRHHNHLQNQPTNDYGQPLLDQNQQSAVINSAQYQPFYFHYPSWQNIPQNLNLTQNLTGQPLFAIQQPLVYQPYGSPYPIMYNIMPQHPIPHHQPELTENDIQEPGISWQAHPTPIYHHSPLENEFQTHPEDYQIMDNPNGYQQEELDSEISFVNEEIAETYSDVKEQGLVEKTRDLMIQTTSPTNENIEVCPPEITVSSKENGNTQNDQTDPEMMPNFPAHQKKQTASVSVSAIPNKDRDTTTEIIHLTEVLEPKISSFSSITASKNPIAPIDHKKTENNQNEVHLIERAKQQIVTTIIGSNKDNEKKVENSVVEVKVNQEILQDEKIINQADLTANVSNLPSPASASSWAGLFNSKSSAKSPIQSMQSIVHPSEPSKPSAITHSETLLVQTSQITSKGSQVPGTTMSYSAVSAQSITPVAKTHPAQHTFDDVKHLPQTKKTNTTDVNSNNKNSVNSNPIDQHSLKLGGKVVLFLLYHIFRLVCPVFLILF